MNTALAHNLWIVCPERRTSASVQLFCFPCAGRGVSLYRTWSKALGPAVEVCGVQYPGRENRLPEPPQRRMPDLVNALLPVLRAETGRPFAFYGHSMGAWIAFETARELRRQGVAGPRILFVSSRTAPHRRYGRPAIAHLPQAELLAAVQARFGGIPAPVLQEPELLAMLLPTLRADLELLESYEYVPEPPLDCPIHAFGGHEDRDVGIADLSAWQEQTSTAYRSHFFPGGHFFLQAAESELLPRIAEELRAISPAALTPAAG